MKRFEALCFVLASFALVIIYFVSFHAGILKTIASSHENLLKGWAWSDNIGWISFTCDNPDDETRCLDTDPGSEPVSNYQVKVEPWGAGKFIGYAWSERIGWIRFDPPPDSPGGYPEDPQNFARLAAHSAPNGKFQVQGWARACAVFDDPVACQGLLSGNSGEWDGWIKMSGNTNSCPNYHTTPPDEASYETCLSSDFKHLDGWAWGGNNVGWIEFDPTLNSVFVPGSSTIFKEVRPR